MNVAGYGVDGGLRRRDFIRVGALPALGLGLGDFLRLKAIGAVGKTARAKAVILIYLGGGMSHVDTFDPKPDAPSNCGGPFRAIATKVAGISVCEHLPRIASQMHRLALVRSVQHAQSEHQQAAHYMLTGWMPSQVVFKNEHPSLGPVVARERCGEGALVPYVVVRDPAVLVNRHHGSAFLGRAFDPIELKVPFDASDIPPPPNMAGILQGMTPERLRGRLSLVASEDRMRGRSWPGGRGDGADEYLRKGAQSRFAVGRGWG